MERGRKANWPEDRKTNGEEHVPQGFELLLLVGAWRPTAALLLGAGHSSADGEPTVLLLARGRGAVGEVRKDLGLVPVGGNGPPVHCIS